jgi:hypothetical protein
MPPSETNLVRLADSERFHRPGTKRLGPASLEEIVHIIMILRPRGNAPPLPDMEHWAKTPPGRRHFLPRHAAAAEYGAAQEDVEKVVAFAKDRGLRVVETNLARRLVEVSGTVAQVNQAFGVTLAMYEHATETYRGHDGPVRLPRGLAEVVQAVFGLDNRRMAFRLGGPSLTISPLTPPDVARLYGFPSVPAGIGGQTIGIFEFGGGYLSDASGHATDCDDFFAGLHPPLPKAQMFTPPVSILGQPNSPGSSANQVDAEVALDIDVSGSIAVGATIAIYFAPYTELGWIGVITTAVSPGAGQPAPSVISISWGGPEEGWSASQLQTLSSFFQLAAAKGVTVFVASGDDGARGGIPDGSAHVNWPPIDPWVTAVGGTTIGNVSGSAFDEVTWNDNGVTSGGISTVTDSFGNLVFPLPSWQLGAGVPPSVNDGKTRGRGIPDIAGYANGYKIILFGTDAGSWWGTSESAPFYAGFAAVLNATLGFDLGYLNTLFYQLAETPGFSIFHDIDDDGSNAFTFTLPPPNPPTIITTPGYKAIKGWDACTGWGSIRGGRLYAALASQPIVATAIASGGKFGNACLSSFVDELLTINNNGFGLLAISDITSSSADFLVPDVSTYPLLVSVGGSIDVVIRFQPVSAGLKSATIKISSNDPSSPHSIPVSGDAVTPKLDLAIADKGDFGATCVGAFVDKPLILSNGGKCMLSITNVSSSSGEFQVPEVLSYPLVIAPGSALPLPIRFAPTSLGSKSATLTVTSNDPAGPHKIDVSGQAPAGKLTVTGSTIFGGVKCCTREQRVVSLCNTGACDLQVSEVALRQGHRAFRLINNPFPATLRPGSCLCLVIEYRAVEKVARACELVIKSDDPQLPVKCLDVIAHTIWEPCCGCCGEPCKSCCEEGPKECRKEHRHECCGEHRQECCDEEEDEQIAHNEKQC